MTARKPPAASKAVRKHLQRSDPPAPAVVLSPAAAWPFPRPDDKAVKTEAPTDDVVVEDQRAIADEQRKAAKRKRTKKAV